MKAKLYKSFYDLHRHEQAAILQSMNEEIDNQVYEKQARNLIRAQRKWLKMMCIALANAGLSKEECLLALANFRQVYITNTKIETDAEQEAWLNAEMDKIFGENGYPEQYIDKLEEL